MYYKYKIEPRANPSSAYNGTVKGDHSFLNIVTKAIINPPIDPIDQTFHPHREI